MRGIRTDYGITCAGEREGEGRRVVVVIVAAAVVVVVVVVSGVRPQGHIAVNPEAERLYPGGPRGAGGGIRF